MTWQKYGDPSDPPLRLTPLEELLQNEQEGAVFHAAFGAAYALKAQAYSVETLARDPSTYSGITRAAWLTAQAAVLEYRRMS